jgi:hypothetical protein
MEVLQCLRRLSLAQHALSSFEMHAHKTIIFYNCVDAAAAAAAQDLRTKNNGTSLPMHSKTRDLAWLQSFMTVLKKE